MSRFIEEFYYGNIDPQARSTKENTLSVPSYSFEATNVIVRTVLLDTAV